MFMEQRRSLYRKMLAVLLVAGIAGFGTMMAQSPFVGAQASPSATRSFSPQEVKPGGQVVVNISAVNYGAGGTVTETLPEGFAYVSSSLSGSQATTDGQSVTFALTGETSFTYTVTVPGSEGPYTFSGALQDSQGNDYPVVGEDTVTVSSRNPLLSRYDTNNDGTIDRGEAIAALRSYLAGDANVPRAEAIAVLRLYLSSPATPRPPGQPTGLTAMANGRTRIDLSWSAPSDDGGVAITGYQIEVSPDGSSWGNLEANTGSTATSYSHTGLTAGTTRHYQVSAINSAGTGPASGVAIGTTDSAPQTGSPATDRAALVALYNATGGRHYWGNKTNWLSDQPLGDWYGVTTDADGRVIRLDLKYNRLRGAIPPELGNLANLGFLDLRPISGGAGLSGTIPPELGNLANLRYLILRDNQLNGEIPPELGNLTNLWDLDLDDNDLSGEIPAELGNLADLRRLYLGFNRLTGEIPAELGRLTKVGRLLLGYNQLSGEIPPELGNLTNLWELNLEYNQLSGEIPPELGNLAANLERLRIWQNQLSGCVPNALRYVPIVRWDVPLCEVPSVTDADGDKRALAAFYHATGGPDWVRSTNWLSDEPLDEWYGIRTNFQGRVSGLSLSNNGLSGEIPPELGNLTKLNSLYLDGNGLSGEIPAELGNLTISGIITLHGNQFDGCVPLSLVSRLSINPLHELGMPMCVVPPPVEANGDRGALVAFFRATGGQRWITELPPATGGWLYGYDLDNWYGVETDVEGRVTGLIWTGERLTGLLGTYRPQLRGGLPPELGNLDRLKRLEVIGQPIHLAIPAELGDLSNLEVLALAGNHLGGEIPPELGNLHNLEELILSANRLSGEIPPELGNLKKLKRLFLSENQLTGCIPPGLRYVEENDFDELGLDFCEH